MQPSTAGMGREGVRQGEAERVAGACGPYVHSQVRTIRDIYCAGVPAFYQVNTASKRAVDCNKAACPIFSL